MDPVVFTEKVRTPDPRGLDRPRLEERLLGPDAPPLGLVLGPPGSGKTTLLARVAASAPGQAAWYRAEADDADEAALARHLSWAVGTIEPAPDGTDGHAAASDIAGLVAALQARPQPLVLVVDDLHELAGTPAERALERLVVHRPRHVRILLGSRRPPALNTSRLLVSGDLVQLDAEDLRFRSWEVEELFRSLYRQPLSPETAAALTRRTGGWAAGLQLFHLGTAGLSRTERETAVAELSGRSRLIRSYLARNVLGELDEQRRRFLLRTCTLGVLTGDSCDALLGTTGSAAVLDELEQQHFLTTSTDDGRTFRYHQVLQTHLEVLLVDELGAPAARELYARSARLLERSGRLAAAIRAYAQADQWESASRLLADGTGSLPGDDEAVWAAFGLPGGPVDDPGLLLAYARRLLRHGLVPEAVAAFAQAAGLMDDLGFRQRCAAERRLAAVFLPDGGGPWPGAPATRSERLARELRGSTADVRDPARPATGLGRTVAALLAGDVQTSARLLAAAEAEGADSETERLLVALVAEVVGAVADCRPPSVPGLEAVAAQADAQGLPWVARVARGLQAAGLLLAAPNEDRAATCADLLQEGELHGDPWSQLLLGVAVGAALALVGESDAATGTLRRAEALAGSLHAPVLQDWAAALRLAARPPGSAETPGDAAELVRQAGRLGVAPAPLLAPGALRSWGASFAPPSRTAPPGSEQPVAVRVRTLGVFALEVDGREVGWSALRPRARMLLMMLVAQHGRPVHRERLVDALWPGAGLSAGVRSLQVAVSSVRQCLARAGLGESVLQRQGDAYALRLDGVDDQCAAFERLVRQGDRLLRDGDQAAALGCRLAAVQRYTGDLLPETGPADWVLEERARLRGLAARTAFAAAELAGELGDLTAGSAAAARSVELDPYTDTGWALLADLHERQGDLSAAAVARREHRRVRAELGLPDRTGPPPARPHRPDRPDRPDRPVVSRSPRPASGGVRARA